MSECKHEKSTYHYYMEEICECGYKKVMDENEAQDKIVSLLVYSKDKVQNCLIRQNEQLTIDLQSANARADKAEKDLEKAIQYIYRLKTTNGAMEDLIQETLGANKEAAGNGQMATKQRG